ncbi:hypothetical protein [Streptomyces humi]|uniref:hypothetical protein n=1 Tax=Streptomyces humi TaxID=1428620 RepID=UPI0006287D73|nr:hypothetical protein [Streptomyces humi]
MPRDDVPHTSDTPLSTEDLAEPRAAGTEQSAPVYPGQADRDDRTDAVGETASSATQPAATGADQAAGAPAHDADDMPQLLNTRDQEGFRERWENIQKNFVDDPREAVEAADGLVAQVMQTLATTFDEHKKALEEQWAQGGQVDTEALRTALRHYRSFFNRLLIT